MGRNYKPVLIKCHACGKSLDRGEFFRPLEDEPICCDCYAATQPDGKVKCKTCSKMHPVGSYPVLTWTNSTASSKRSLSCESCCKKMKSNHHRGGGQESKLRKNPNLCACGKKAVEKLRGEYLCADCLNPDYPNDYWHGSHSNIGSAGSLCVDCDGTADRSRG